MTKRLTRMTTTWPASANLRSSLTNVHQSDDRTGVTCHDLTRAATPSVPRWPSLHKSRSPDSLYAALLVIRTSVKLSIAKTRPIGRGRLGDAWNYKFPGFYLSVLCNLRQNSNTKLKNFARFGKIVLRLASSLNNSRFEVKMIYSI